MKYIAFCPFHSSLHQVFSFGPISFVLHGVRLISTPCTSYKYSEMYFHEVFSGPFHEVLTWSIFIWSHFICLIWRTSNSCDFMLAYMKYFNFEPFDLSYMMYFPFGKFHYTAHEIFSYPVISFVLHDVLEFRSIYF